MPLLCVGLMIDPEDDDLYDLPDAPQPFWTRHRMILLIFVIIIVVTFLVYMFSGLFLPPAPPPTLAPGSLI